ncbi:MAG: Do family serine endopeptidase [Elusimicrobia bacterium]|nr:Do family serine endopeptidase [Candidatus Obscuribacterium magneticum]
MFKKLRPVALVVFLSLVSVMWASGQSWWEKLLPRKNPEVLQGGAKKAPVEVPPAVLNLQESFAKVAEAVRPAVVNISAVHITKVQEEPNQFFFGDPNEFFYRFFGEEAPPPQQRRRPQEFRSEGTGSGVIIDPDGYILTNNHVVQGADQLTVTLENEKKVSGKVVGTDPRTDLAVIKIKSTNPLPYAPLGDSANVRIGDWVLAVGSPFGLEQTVTAGIISARRQTLNIEGRAYRNLLQTDAAINRGNSGGPLVNLKGEVIGINTAIYAPTGVFSGIGFAIPVNEAKSILKDLIEKGYVERSWMGVEIIEIDEVMAKQFGLKSKEGALINSVLPKSPAEKAGLKRGDVVAEFDGKKVASVMELQDVVQRTPPKKSVQIKVIRNGTSKTFTLVTEVMPKQEEGAEGKQQGPKGEKESKVIWLGATFSDIDDSALRKFGLDRDSAYTNVKGVLVVDVPSDSVAADAGLIQGDVIAGINQREIDGIAAFEKVTKGVNVKEGVVFDLIRQGRSFYLSYKSLR